jgi:transposase InsO family protein
VIQTEQKLDPALASRKPLSIGTTSPATNHNKMRFESFNGYLRDKLLNETLFGSLAHARVALARWKLDCNTVRPLSSIGNLVPGDYAKRARTDRRVATAGI